MFCHECIHYEVCSCDRIDANRNNCEQFINREEVAVIQHASWVTDVRTFKYTSPDTVNVRKVCDFCGHGIKYDQFDKDAWEGWHKDHWNPETPKYCSECGSLMDAEVQ